MSKPDVYYSVFMRSVYAYGLPGAYVERFRSQYRKEAEATYNAAVNLIGTPKCCIYAAKLTYTDETGIHLLMDYEAEPPKDLPPKRHKKGDTANEKPRRPMHSACFRR